MSWRRRMVALGWIPILWTFNEHLYTVNIITGTSMQLLQPTLNPNSTQWRDVAIFNRFSVRSLSLYRRGDIVAVRPPSNKGPILVKRILALEGDTVKTLPPYPVQEIVVPTGHAWVEGDDHWRSQDSNQFGPVPLALIDSRLTWIIWPLSRFGPTPRSGPWDRKVAAQRSLSDFDSRRWSRVKLGHIKDTWEPAI